MEQNIEQVKNKKVFLEVDVIKDPDKGLLISLKSVVNFKFLAHSSKQKMVVVGKVRCYSPLQDQLQGINGYFKSSGDDYEYEGFPNLQLLLAENLNEGVTFEFGLIPVSNENLIKWGEKFKEQVKSIYLMYCKPYEYSIKFTTETIEKEQHD